MKDNRIRTGVELVGLVAVVLSVLFLAVQVRQGNQVARATVAYELNNMFNDYHDLVISDAHVADLLVRMTDDSGEFTEVEQRQIRAIANRLFNVWSSAHQGFDNGVVSSEDYETYSRDVVRAMSLLRAAVPVWREFLDAFPARAAWPIFAPLIEVPQ